MNDNYKSQQESKMHENILCEWLSMVQYLPSTGEDTDNVIELENSRWRGKGCILQEELLIISLFADEDDITSSDGREVMRAHCELD